MASIRCSGTRPEEICYSLLRSIIGHKWRINKNVNSLPGRPDLIIPTLKVIIFIDGCFYHHCPKHGHIPKSNIEYWKPKLEKNKKRDKINRLKLRKMGYTVINYWEHDFKRNNLSSIKVKMDTKLNKILSKYYLLKNR